MEGKIMKTVQQLIDEALVRKLHQKSGKFSPSLFGRCYRLQYWNRKAEPQSNPPDKRTLRVFKAGNLFEQFVKGLIILETITTGEKDGTNWIDCGKDPIECDDVKGFADLKCDNEVADVKSQHSKSFWWMTKSKDIKKDKFTNWLQVMYYTRELGKKFGRLIYISKDDLCIQEYVQPLDDYWLKQLNVELCALRYLWKKQELPPAVPRTFIQKDGSSKGCEYCQFQDKCKLLEKENENG